MKRKTLTKATRVRIFDAARGLCGLCGLPIKVGEPWQADHKKQLWAGGEDDEANLQPAHVACHAVKSSADAPLKAKTDRVRANHLGVKTPPVRPLQSGNNLAREKPKKEHTDPHPDLGPPAIFRRFKPS